MSFIPADRDPPDLLPPSVDAWLPAHHLARFIREVIDQRDRSRLTQGSARRGSQAHHPAVLLAWLVSGYATGVFSCRKIERATDDAVAFRFLAANTHPDHDPLATFRKRFLPELEELFVHVLSIAQTMKRLPLGQITLDGSKLKANASKHQALSHGHLDKRAAPRRDAGRALLATAETTDREELPDGLDLPAELARREAQRQAGKPPRGQEPPPPAAGSRPSRQGPGQPDRRSIPDHAGLRRRLRASRQRPGRGRCRDEARAGDRGDSTDP